MKTRKTELDVDFIGGQEPLTTAEEQALSEYFKKRKLTTIKRLSKTVKRESNRSKVTTHCDNIGQETTKA